MEEEEAVRELTRCLEERMGGRNDATTDPRNDERECPVSTSLRE